MVTALSFAKPLGDDENRKYSGRHIRKPSVKLCAARLRNIRKPRSGFASDVIKVIKPSGSLCKDIAKVVWIPISNRRDKGVFTWW